MLKLPLNSNQRTNLYYYYHYYYHYFIPSVSRIPRDFGKKIDTKEKIVGVTITPSSPPEQKNRAAERCTSAETRWNKNAVSRSSPECWLIFFARSDRKSEAGSLGRESRPQLVGKDNQLPGQNIPPSWLLPTRLYWSCFSGSRGYIGVRQRTDDCDVPNKSSSTLPRN